MDALIIAAGKGTRMGDTHLPKALAIIGDIPNIRNTIAKLDKHVYCIYIVVNTKEIEIFKSVLYDKLARIKFIELNEALGSGDAVFKSLLKSMDHISDNSLIIWGDTYFNNDAIIKEIISIESTSELIFPVVDECNPYCTFTHTDHNIESVDFSVPEKGYHDQSIFLINSSKFYKSMLNLYNVYWDGTKYTSNTGDFNFMSIIQYLNNINSHAKIYITEHQTLGYNTPKDIENIEKTLSEMYK